MAGRTAPCPVPLVGGSRPDTADGVAAITAGVCFTAFAIGEHGAESEK
ncbi:MAG: hypothetical protein ACOH2J_02450 [Allorhizobium sp.]